jgi:TolA-binding protein
MKTMMIRLLLVVCLLLAGTTLPAQPSKPGTLLVDRPDYQAALRASSQGLFEVAALKFERLLAHRHIDTEDAAKVSERLVDALLRTHKEQKALVALTLYEVPDSSYWKAQALILQRKFKEAEWELKAYLTAPGRYTELAKLSLGQVLIAQERENTGRQEFKDLLSSKDARVANLAKLWHFESEIMVDRSAMVLKKLGSERSTAETEFLKATAYLKMGEGKQAEIILRRLLDAKPSFSKPLHDACVIRLAEAYVGQARARTGEKLLLKFIDEEPSSDYYEEAFALLDKCNAPEGAEEVHEKLQAWSETAVASKRQALALYYLALWETEIGKVRDAIRALETFYDRYPAHLYSGQALRLLMSLYGQQRDDEKVLELAKVWQNRFGSGGDEAVDYLTGMIRFARAEYADAAKLFESSASIATDWVLKERAIYNLAVCAFLGGEDSRFQQCLAQLEAQPEGADAVPSKAGSSKPAATLMLEKALQLASKRDPAAEDALQEFIKKNPEDPRYAEAQLALAELCLLALPPRARSAQSALDAAAQSPGINDGGRERVDYTRVWLQEATGSDSGIIAEGIHFLELWLKSARRDEVRIKVAQAHYRLEDYAKAESQFEALVEENPDSPYAEIALFFAGKAAMNLLTAEGLDKALTLWAEVATREGPLAREARREQASAKRRQGNEAAALGVIDSLLTSEPPPEGEEQLSLLIEKGELMALLSKDDHDLLGNAAQVFATVAGDSSASRVWRSRAGVLLSQVYSQMGKNTEALEASTDVVETSLASASTQPLSPQDFLWLYRAGFAALDMLEARQSWEAAALLADRLAKTTGDRASEAKDRATRLRLEHFLWEK